MAPSLASVPLPSKSSRHHPLPTKSHHPPPTDSHHPHHPHTTSDSQLRNIYSMSPSQRCTGPTPWATKDDTTPTAVLPGNLSPPVFDPAKRLQQLKDGLNPASSFYYFYEGQHPNIRAAIKAYESGKMPLGSTTYFVGGKSVSEAEAAAAKTFVWKEVCWLFHHSTFLACRFKTLTVTKP